MWSLQKKYNRPHLYVDASKRFLHSFLNSKFQDCLNHVGLLKKFQTKQIRQTKYMKNENPPNRNNPKSNQGKTLTMPIDLFEKGQQWGQTKSHL